jgi:hypothetical protein
VIDRAGRGALDEEGVEDAVDIGTHCNQIAGNPWVQR